MFLEIPIKNFSGNGSFLAGLVLFLSFIFCGFCDSSVNLGFEVCGFDRSRNWVSENGVFEFGFFERDSSEFDGLVVGIRYNLGTKGANMHVWTVGGGLRVSMNSTFRLSMDGRLVLFENSSGLIVWSSNTSSLGVKKATLLDSGNLVLMSSEDKVIWESFNSPTSTLLPGQSFQFPQNLRAPSTKSISSYYNFVIRRSGELALVWENNVTYWRSPLTSFDIVKEARFDSSGVLGLYDDAKNVVWKISSKDFEDANVILRHLRIEQDGNLRIYSWDKQIHAWRVGWQAVEDQCNVFGYCGLYSVCGYNSTGAVCSCLYTGPATDSGGSGCEKMVDLSNCKMQTSMVVMKKTVLYSLYPPHDVDIMLSEDACKEYCSNDTSCIAVTSRNDGSGICTIKRTSFISGYETPYALSTSFLKVCLVPQAVVARGANPGSVSLSSGKVGYREENVKKVTRAIAFVVLGTVSIILTAEIFAVWFIFRRRKIKDQTRVPFGKDHKMNPHYSSLIRLSFEEVKELTTNFATQLGPSVYKGVLPNKTPVIARLIDRMVVSEKEFRVTVSTLGGTHHRNLVALKGFCFELKHKIIIYEYVPNGSLDKWLFDVEREKNESNWEKTLDIAIGVAKAIAYLHTECQKCIPHGKLKLENVLLDENLVPKLTDFGLLSLLQNEEVSSVSSSSLESLPERDIYMLGEMLLQIVTRKRGISVNSLDQVINMFKREQRFLGIEDLKGIQRVVRIALWCMQDQPFSRPSIGEVVKVLEGTLPVDSPPSSHVIRHESKTVREIMTEIEVES